MPLSLTKSVRRLAAIVGLLAIALPCWAALEYDEYIERAQKARQRGDWQDAATNYAEAINHPDRPRKPAEWSELHLDYGRAMGVLCQFSEAATFLERALEIARKGNVATARALYELGSLASAEKKPATAVLHLMPLMTDLEKREAAQLSMAQWADARAKLAANLAAVGKAEEAARWRPDSSVVNAGNTKDIVPYGSRCNAR